MPRSRWAPRFTVRRLMVAVAIGAILLTAERTRRVWSERSRKAAAFAAEARSWAEDATKVESMMATARSRGESASRKRAADLDEFVRNYRGHVRSYRDLAAKYERAVRRPWLPVPPDPPEPE